jgi:hypothetical protein
MTKKGQLTELMQKIKAKEYQLPFEHCWTTAPLRHLEANAAKKGEGGGLSLQT